MNLDEVAKAYLDQLVAQGEAVVRDFSRDQMWTRRATLALAQLGQSLFPEHEVITKGHGSTRTQRDKHLALDVAIVNPNDWSVPVLIGEHESSPRRARIQLDAWRLLCIDARVRILIAYYGPGTELDSFEALREAMHEVARDHRGKKLLVIGAESTARPETFDELRSVHRWFSLGHETAT